MGHVISNNEIKLIFNSCFYDGTNCFAKNTTLGCFSIQFFYIELGDLHLVLPS